MPIYEYACTACGNDLEMRQSFTDASLTVCPVCGGALRKVLSPVGVVFKGSGFYRNDSRATAHDANGSGAAKAAASSGTKKSDGASTASGSGSNGSGSTDSGSSGSSGTSGSTSSSGDSGSKSPATAAAK
ncbi:MAG: FmdB family zinc ribbon protein [Nocardioidaceae bacterium]